MSNYIINHNVEGFETTTIDDERLCSSDNEVILILDGTTSDNLVGYYSKVTDMLIANTKLITICIGKESKIRKSIFMLMALYKNYNMYIADSKGIVNQDYIRILENRTPDLSEIQQYIGGDVSAYSDASTILIGIANLVKDGDLDGLKYFIEQHYESIQTSSEVIEYLKKLSDSSNSGELSKMIDSMKSRIDSINKENTSIKSELKQVKQEKETLNDNVSRLQREISVSKRRVSDLEEMLDSKSDGPVITTYKETNTAMIRCKVQTVIYFKEISYARYTNTLVISLMNMISQIMKKQVKLIIYDNRVGIPSIYKGISILSSADYLPNKAKILRDTPKYVVSEPNSAFIEDVLQSNSPIFDVAIVYDRLRQPTNIVSGNNVTKIFVINSFGEFENVKNPLKITTNNLVISGDARIKGSLIIPEIPDFYTATDSARLSRYTKCKSIGDGNEFIINTILSKARLMK